MMILDNLALFLRIVEKGGLAPAGRELGLSPASVSERLVALERYYGAALLHRTTRAISLTDEGRLLVEGARRLLAEADELEALIRLGVEKISGPIRLSAPIDLGRSYRRPDPRRVPGRAPGSDDRSQSDGWLRRSGRARTGSRHPVWRTGGQHLARQALGKNRRVVCASPAYLRSRGTPQHPDDLTQHECILMRFGPTIDREWPFLIDGKKRADRGPGASGRERRRLGPGLVPERLRPGSEIALGCRGGPEGRNSRRASPGTSRPAARGCRSSIRPPRISRNGCVC